MTSFVPDAATTSTYDTALPDFTAVVSQQRMHHEGFWLSGNTIQLLVDLGQDLVIGRLQKLKYSAALRELETAALVEGTKLTRYGQVASALMNDAPYQFGVSALHHGQEEMLQIWANDGMAVVVAGSAWNDGRFDPDQQRPDDQHFNLDMVPLLDLSTHILRWLGIGPAWNLPLEPDAIGADILDAKVMRDAPPPAPSDANDAFKDAWTEPWMIWSFDGSSSVGSLESLTYVHAGRRGQYRLAQPDDQSLLLVPFSSSMVLDQIEDRIQAVLFARPVLLT
jgi:hypothetical protein